MPNEPRKPSFGSSHFALHIMGLSIFTYAWQVHGALAAIVAAVSFYVLVPVLNVVAVLKFENLRLSTIFRFALFIGIMALIAVSGAKVCDVAAGGCRGLS